jgi:hypothetical protein
VKCLPQLQTMRAGAAAAGERWSCVGLRDAMHAGLAMRRGSTEGWPLSFGTENGSGKSREQDASVS